MSTIAPATPARSPRLIARLSAEALGSLFLVVAGIGVPLFSVPQTNPMSAPLAAGLAVTASMLAFGYLSGGHFNPAITLGNVIAGRTKPIDGVAYVGAQLVGGLAGGLVLFGVVRTVPKIEDSRTAFDTVTAGFGEHSLIQVPLAGVLLVEVIGVALLVGIFLATTARTNSSRAMAPFAVGLTTAVLLQLGESMGNIPFNPARATASAVFSSGWSLQQLWLFWVAPLAGAAIAGLVVRGFADFSSASSLGREAEAAALSEVTPQAGHAEHGLDAADDFDAQADIPSGNAHAAPAGEAGPVGEAGPKGAPKPGTDDEARDFFDGKRG
jgi:aquaporin Z